MLPRILRPGLRTRELQPGLDFPCWFIDGLRGLDPNLHFVWHPYKLMYDDFMNADSGTTEDSRFVIGRDARFGEEEIWGFVLTDGRGAPRPENKWHLWRLCWPYGWAHVTRLDQINTGFLRFALNRMYLQDRIASRYGARAWNIYEREEKETAREHEIENLDQLMMDTTKENKWLLREAMDNFHRKQVNATRPTKDIIVSHDGQTNRSRIVRELTDREGGLVLPDRFNKDN